MNVIDVSDWNGNEWEYELIPIEPEPEPQKHFCGKRKMKS